MRTTLTLDDDVAEFLRQQCKLLDKPFKQVVNEVMRRGMSPSKESGDLPKFEIIPNRSRFVRGIDPLKLNQLNDELEVEDFDTEMLQ